MFSRQISVNNLWVAQEASEADGALDASEAGKPSGASEAGGAQQDASEAGGVQEASGAGGSPEVSEAARASGKPAANETSAVEAGAPGASETNKDTVSADASGSPALPEANDEAGAADATGATDATGAPEAPGAPEEPETAASEDKQAAPDFAMSDWDGNDIKLSDIIANGKPIVLNFWASWCPPCKSEMPEFEKVFLELGDDVQFIMLDLTDGQRETVKDGVKYIEEQGFSFPVFFDTNQEGANTYGIRSIPTSLFIDKDGYLVAGAEGAINEEILRKAIDMIK